MYRGAPFTQGVWETLTTQTLSSADILAPSLTRSTSGVVNLYSVYPEGINQSASTVTTKMYAGIVDVDSALRYGLSPLSVPLYGLINAQAKNQFVPNKVSQWTRDRGVH